MKPGDRYNPHKRLLQIHIPLGMVESGRFSPIALVVYGRLQFHKNPRADSCFVYRKTLAQELKISIAKLDRAIRELCAGGVIRVQKRGPGQAAEYVFLYSELFDDSALVTSQDVHLEQVEAVDQEQSDSAPMRSQERSNSARLRSQQQFNSAPMRTQEALTSQNRASDFAKTPEKCATSPIFTRPRMTLKEYKRNKDSSYDDQKHPNLNGTPKRKSSDHEFQSYTPRRVGHQSIYTRYEEKE
jgi:hypothetical protein